MNPLRHFFFGRISFGRNPAILAGIFLTISWAGIVRADPPDARIQLEQKARYWVENGREDLAADTYRQLLFLYPDDKKALTGLIQAYILEGESGKAAPLIQTFGERYPRSPYLPIFRREETLGAKWSVLVARARKAEKDRRYSRAEVLFRKAFGDAFPPPSLAGEYYHLAAKTPGARRKVLSDLKALTDRYPDSASYRLAYGEILSDKESSRREGVRVLRLLALSTAPEAVQARADWKKSLIWAGDNPSFIPELSDYLETFPDPTIEHLLERARRRALAEGPLPEKAFDALHRGKMAEARDRFLLLVREDPENPSYWTGLASAQLALSRPDKASEALEKVDHLPLSVAQRREVRLLDRQVLYWRMIERGKRQERSGNRGKAARFYRFARKILPGQTTAADSLAGLELRRGRPRQALAIARQTLARHPEDPQALSVVLGALESLHHYQKAEKILRSVSRDARRVLERSPSFLVLEGTVDAHAGQVAQADRELAEAGRKSFLLSVRDQIARAWAYAALGETMPLEAILRSLEKTPERPSGSSAQVRKLENFDLFLSVNRLLAEKNGKAAKKRVLSFLLEHPGDRFGIRQEIRVDLSIGQPAEAFALLRSLHPEKRFSDTEDGIESALASGHLKTAGRWIGEARDRWGNRIGLIVLESRYMADTGHWRKAHTLLRKSLNRSPASVRLHLAMARLDLRKNLYKEARNQALDARKISTEKDGIRSRTDALEVASTLEAISRQQESSSGSHLEFLLGETVFTQYTQYYYAQIGGFFPVGTQKGVQGQEPVYLHAFVQGNAFTFQYHPSPASGSFLSQTYVGTTPAVGLRVPTFFGSVEADAGWGVALHDQTLTPPGVVSGLFLQGDLSADIAQGDLDLFANYTGYIAYTYFQSRYLHPVWNDPAKALALAAGPEFIVQGNDSYSAFQGGVALRFSISPLDSTLLLDGGVLRSSAFGGIGGYEGFSWYFYY